MKLIHKRWCCISSERNNLNIFFLVDFWSVKVKNAYSISQLPFGSVHFRSRQRDTIPFFVSSISFLQIIFFFIVFIKVGTFPLYSKERALFKWHRPWTNVKKISNLLLSIWNFFGKRQIIFETSMGFANNSNRILMKSENFQWAIESEFFLDISNEKLFFSNMLSDK